MHFLYTLLRVINPWPLLIAAAICVPLEKTLPLHPRAILRKGWKSDIAYLFVNGYLVGLALMLPIMLAAYVSRLLLPAHFIAGVSSQPLWLQVIEALLIGDFALYWAHRALHANQYLWRFHAVHHAVEELDWVAAYHLHPIDSAILAGAALGTVTAVGLSSSAIAVYLTIYGIVSVAVHVNTRLRTGPLRWVFGSPEFHHWHHSNDSRIRDKNFASIIAFWDVLFGTAYLPRNRAPRFYGIAEMMPDSYGGQLLYPFWRRMDEAAPAIGEPTETLP